MAGKKGAEGEVWASDRGWKTGVSPRRAKGYETQLLWAEGTLPTWGQKPQAPSLGIPLKGPRTGSSASRDGAEGTVGSWASEDCSRA